MKYTKNQIYQIKAAHQLDQESGVTEIEYFKSDIGDYK